MAQKSLVLYFSLYGDTQTMAELLGRITRGTVVPLQVETPFPDDMNAVNDVAEAQRAKGTFPALAGPLPAVQDYDIVLLGGPVWNGHVATPLRRLIQDTDFGIVPVAPFYTYATDPGAYAQEVNALLEPSSRASLGMSDETVKKTNQATAELQKWWDTVRPQ